MMPVIAVAKGKIFWSLNYFKLKGGFLSQCEVNKFLVFVNVKKKVPKN